MNREDFERDPIEVDDVTLAFPANIGHLLPAWDDIPEDFKRERDSGWTGLASTWFAKGLDSGGLVPRPGLDKTKALRHLAAIMGSFEPKHEHKIAGVGYLMSLWFESWTEVQHKGTVTP